MSEPASPSGAPNPYRAARENAGLTQLQVASKLGVRPATVVAWEQGVQPRAGMQAKIAELFGVPAEQLAPPTSVDRGGRTPEGDPFDELVAALSPGVRQADGSVVFPPETYGFLLGQLATVAHLSARMADQVDASAKTTHAMAAQMDASARTAQALGNTLSVMRRSMERVNSSVADLTRGGVMPSPTGMTLDDVRASVERLRQRKQQEAQQRDDDQQPRAG